MHNLNNEISKKRIVEQTFFLTCVFRKKFIFYFSKIKSLSQNYNLIGNIEQVGPNNE